MRELLTAGVMFVLIVTTIMIGAGISAQAYNITYTAAVGTGSIGLLTSIFTSTNMALTTLSNFLPIIAIALVGGLALSYLGQYILRGAGSAQ